MLRTYIKNLVVAGLSKEGIIYGIYKDIHEFTDKSTDEDLNDAIIDLVNDVIAELESVDTDANNEI